MYSRLLLSQTTNILNQNNFKSIESLQKLYFNINRNRLYSFNNIYISNNYNRVMTRNLCLSCFPCIKIPKQNYSNSSENLISLESQNQNNNSNQIASTEDAHKKCIFCHLDKNRIIYEDDKIIAFHDIKPAAKIHILIIPREHIVSVKDLTYKDHKEMLENMKVAGVKILKDFGYTKPCLKNENHKIYDSSLLEGAEEGDKEITIPNTLLISNKEYDSILGFHIPPFTSVGHLHLHLLGLPFKNFVKSCKYKSIRFPHYFESIDNIIEELKKKDEKHNASSSTPNNGEAPKNNVTSQQPPSQPQPQAQPQVPKPSETKQDHIIDVDSNPASSSNPNTLSSSSSSPNVATETTPIYPK